MPSRRPRWEFAKAIHILSSCASPPTRTRAPRTPRLMSPASMPWMSNGAQEGVSSRWKSCQPPAAHRPVARGPPAGRCRQQTERATVEALPAVRALPERPTLDAAAVGACERRPSAYRPVARGPPDGRHSQQTEHAAVEVLPAVGAWPALPDRDAAAVGVCPQGDCARLPSIARATAPQADAAPPAHCPARPGCWGQIGSGELRGWQLPRRSRRP